jgi:cell division septation protein DedD
MEGIREMPMDNKKPEHAASEKVLWIVLSALGVMALAVVAGILLFYKPGQTERARFTSSPIEPDTRQEIVEDNGGQGDAHFDADKWARENGETPDLEQPVKGTETTDADGEIVINWAPEGSGEKTAVQIQPVQKKTEPVAKKTEPAADIVKTEPARTRKEEAVVWWIQVASFSSSFKAESMSETLYMKGFPTSIQTQVVNGKTWYRIRVGAFGSKAEADSFQKKLENLPEIDSPIIVKGTIIREVPAN